MQIPDSPVRQFVGGYLHQDWPEFYGSWQAAADAFVRDEPEDAANFGGQAAQLLRDHPTSPQLGGILQELGCFYWPSRYDSDYVRWFEEVVAHIDASVRQS